ncbi:MAG: molybdopterin converting factor subunit 1 [Bacillaceae bacterium]|nr:molybdopterin converting factor subunit 1 [Bacillaceae bacterium]
MKITVLLFAGLAETAGTSQVELELNEGATVLDVKQALGEQLPDLKSSLENCFASVNQEYATDSQPVQASDEIALLPPVSGGSEEESDEDRFLITTEPLSADRVIQQVVNPYAGAVLTFVGTVREFTNGQKTVYLKYEAYQDMAVKTMKQIEQEILEKWPDARVAIHHRIGELDIEEISVIIAVATPHRDDSFKAGRYAIERLKQIVPIWKKEIWEDGSEWKGHQLGPWNPTEKLDLDS